MNCKNWSTIGPIFVVVFLLHVFLGFEARGQDLAERFKRLTAGASWTLVSADTVAFDTFHPQGMALVDNFLYVTSVEVREWPRQLAEPEPDRDRTDGSGSAWLFVMDREGRLHQKTELTPFVPAAYHPGGIDFDGQWLWTPLAFYRPNSLGVILRIHPETLVAESSFRYADHLGAVVHAHDRNEMYAMNWGSRHIIKWKNIHTDDIGIWRYSNSSHYIDYQDCTYLSDGQALCAGVKTLRQDGTLVRLGGIDLVELETGRPLHQIPVPLWTEKGLPLTQNPFEVELTERGLRFFFLPEDNTSRLFIYDVEVLIDE